MTRHTLEPTAQQIAGASKPSFLHEPGPHGAPEVLDDTRAAPIAKPAGAAQTLPAVLYVHGSGGGRGNTGPHVRLVRELAAGTNGWRRK